MQAMFCVFARDCVRTSYIEMRRNKLKSIDMFQDCTNLEILDLSFNEIDHVTDINMAIGNVTKLNLAHNLLESTDGLQKLFALQDLDISHNSITIFSRCSIKKIANPNSLCT